MIILKNENEIDLMRKAGKILGETLNLLKEKVRPGITTTELDRIAEEFITKHGATPSFKGLYGFPGSYELKDGDIVSIDCGVCLNGFHSDAARTFGVGNISEEAEKLIRITEESFFKGIEKAYVDNRLTDISNEIQQYVEANGFSVVRDFVGHGIGRKVHEDPEVPNFGRPGRGPKLMAGMVLAIEPMVNMGSYRVKTLDDGWTVVTADGKLSAHYENTVAILPNGPEILTLIK